MRMHDIHLKPILHKNEDSLKKSRFRQKKSLGQVFLKDMWPIERIVDHVKEWNVAEVIEIGPGLGVLTQALLEIPVPVTAIEKDHRLGPILLEKFATHPLKIHQGDVLDFPLKDWLNAAKGSTAIVGNIPYYISAPILEWVLPHLHRIAGCEFMVQKEFAQRAIAAAGSEHYGRLSVFVQLYAKAEISAIVKRGSFRPQPKVDSALMRLEPRFDPLPLPITKSVEQLTRVVFTKRRKTVRNGLKGFYSEDAIERCGPFLEMRPEVMSVTDFVHMAELLGPASLSGQS